MVRITTSLRSDLGRLVLANSITLTPGTLSVDIDGETLLVHWIDCPPGTDIGAPYQPPIEYPMGATKMKPYLSHKACRSFTVAKK